MAAVSAGLWHVEREADLIDVEAHSAAGVDGGVQEQGVALWAQVVAQLGRQLLPWRLHSSRADVLAGKQWGCGKGVHGSHFRDQALAHPSLLPRWHNTALGTRCSSQAAWQWHQSGSIFTGATYAAQGHT